MREGLSRVPSSFPPSPFWIHFRASLSKLFVCRSNPFVSMVRRDTLFYEPLAGIPIEAFLRHAMIQPRGLLDFANIERPSILCAPLSSILSHETMYPHILDDALSQIEHAVHLAYVYGKCTLKCVRVCCLVKAMHFVLFHSELREIRAMCVKSGSK